VVLKTKKINKATELRTHNPPLSNYVKANIDIPTFLYLMKNGYESELPYLGKEIEGPRIKEFRDNLFPKLVGEEAWIAYERKDKHWRERSYFMTAALCIKDRPQFYSLINSICDDKNNVQKVFEKVKQYCVAKPPKGIFIVRFRK